MRLALVAFALALSSALAAADFVWMEGESPTKATVEMKKATQTQKQLLSGETWGQIQVGEGEVDKAVGDDGIVLSYAFTLDQAGDWQVWDRIGFEFVRSPFSWRVDQGEWAEIKPDQLTTDLMELDFWCEVAWLKLGQAKLDQGAHALEIRLNKRKIKNDKGEEKWDRILYASDALCVAKDFHPNGPHQPDAKWQSDNDLAAAKQVFQLPEAKGEGARSSVALNGLWEICRNDEDLPPADIAVPMTDLPKAPIWKSIAVPGDKNSDPSLTFAHRVWYRARVNVPASAAGRSLFIEFPQNNLNTTVLVNGVPCGFEKNPYCRFQIDVTPGIKPGQVNELWVGIRDAWYGYTNSPKDPMKLRRCFNLPLGVTGQGFQRMAYPMWTHMSSGILQTPTLVMAGGAYASDVFCKPSVARKQLDLDVTVRNPSDKPAQGEIVCEAVDDESGKVAKAFAAKPFSVAPKTEALVAAGDAWADPVLWWPDQPHLYRLRATVKVGGKAVDVSETTFGFREWTSEGVDFKLNGIVWPVWADLTMGDTKESFLENYRKHHLRTYRYWGTSWLGLPPEQALDFFDRSGVVIRRTGILDGEGIGYMAIEEDPELKKDGEIKMDLLRHWREQEVASVKGERNHPSVMVWSIENEWLYINCINLYGNLMDQFEAETAKTSEAVRAVDPTRFTMVDGGGATKAQTLPVHGDHYVFDAEHPGLYPALAYSSNQKGGGRGRWEWDMKRPRFLGEDYFATGINPFDYAAFGGEECFQGKAATRRTVGLIMRMLAEGYRWAGYGGFHFWLGTESALDQYNSFSDVALFCRQWDWTFGAKDQVKRTLRLFNDSRYDDPISATWTFTVGGKKLAGETKDYALKAGTSQELEITLPCPECADRVEGELTFALTQRGKPVFSDTKKLSVLGESKVARPALAKLAAKDLLVLDPQGGVIAALTAAKIPFTKIDDLKAPAEGARVLLIGKDALDPAHAATPELQAWAAPGRSVIVLEQKDPLKYQGLPADLEPQQNQGCIAFIEDTDHPAARGLTQQDFFTWGADEVVYRDAYVKATRGAKSLVQCHNRLADSALSEMPVGQGVLLVSQLALGEKAASNAVARRLLLNLLDYAGGYKLEYRQVAGCVGDNPLLKRELDAIELKYDPVTDPLKALGANKIAVITATPANLKALAGANDQVQAWMKGGGWLVLNGLTPEGLADYNKVVGVQHLIRPFRMERVTFPASRHPLTAGLTTGDIVMQSSKRINAWTADVYLAGDEFSYIVDYDDVAPFARFPEPSRFGYTEGGNDHNPLNMVNGFFSSDGWQYIFSIPLKAGVPHDFDLTWPVEQELTEIEWAGNAFYKPVTKLALTMDHDAARSVKLDTAPSNEPQTFPIEPHLKGKTLTVDLAAWQENDKGGVVGVDNIRLKAARSPEFYRDVKPLLNIGAMMAYPKGQGGALLCNVQLLEKEEVEANQRKKRAILATLLRNLKAPFAGGKTVIAGSAGMKYQPIDLTKFATAYRDEKGWFGDKAHTFRDLPTGEQRLANVTYQIYDFPTSPVPTVIMLGAKGIPNDPPEEVKGIPVGKKADALFFLHTARMDARMNAKELQEKKRYEMLRYVVHYADGQSVDIPIYAEIDIDSYIQKDPKPLPGAQIAWTRKFDQGGEYAVAYTKQWNNPRADAEITSIDVKYGEHKRGVPAVIAITAATAP